MGADRGEHPVCSTTQHCAHRAEEHRRKPQHGVTAGQGGEHVEQGGDDDRAVALHGRVHRAAKEDLFGEAIAQGDRGVLLITHYTRILNYIKPDHVHVLVDGRVAESGGPELAEQLEAEGYARFEKAAAGA